MQLGMIGLGRMGANLARRLTKDGQKCVVYDLNPAVAKLASPRAVWVMVPTGVAGATRGISI